MKKLEGGYYEIKPDVNKKPVIYSNHRQNAFIRFWKYVFNSVKGAIGILIKIAAIIAVGYLMMKIREMTTL